MAQSQLNSPKGRPTPRSEHSDSHRLDFSFTDSSAHNFSDDDAKSNGQNDSPNEGNNNMPCKGNNIPHKEGDHQVDLSDGEIPVFESGSGSPLEQRSWRKEKSTSGDLSGRKSVKRGQNFHSSPKGKRSRLEFSSSEESSDSTSSSDSNSSDSDTCFDPNNNIISKADSIPSKITRFISKYANQGISKDTRLNITKNCKVPNHRGLKPKETDRFLKKLFRRKFNTPMSDKKERAIINTGSRILDAAGPLAILWNEQLMKLKNFLKKGSRNRSSRRH